ncbi:hypothetical protein [Nocardioides sp. B-3]|uniref:hypothetical protein n=1 Tax=Nocardioides sp. B-3 TaxID=2895565 RepID=UPI00215378C2|nr:hypothetical protein [Nocardioides sp. B-3]UUZ57803.1 hypothetical protein LP418_15495 [Nocardioides sp. B-3]
MSTGEVKDLGVVVSNREHHLQPLDEVGRRVEVRDGVPEAQHAPGHLLEDPPKRQTCVGVDRFHRGGGQRPR